MEKLHSTSESLIIVSAKATACISMKTSVFNLSSCETVIVKSGLVLHNVAGRA